MNILPNELKTGTVFVSASKRSWTEVKWISDERNNMVFHSKHYNLNIDGRAIRETNIYNAISNPPSLSLDNVKMIVFEGKKKTIRVPIATIHSPTSKYRILFKPRITNSTKVVNYSVVWLTILRSDLDEYKKQYIKWHNRMVDLSVKTKSSIVIK